MGAIRMPAVAGTFYTANPVELEREIDALIEADGASDSDETPKALIAPHAGYVYSGPIAASVYRKLRPGRGRIKRVILLGPSHRVGFRGIAASSADYFRTPLGDIPVDTNAIKEVVGLPNVGYLDEAHTHEHSLEVHLPFLQRVLGDFSLVPLVVGDANKEEVAQVLEKLWGAEETLIVISSDLSHYHPYDEARTIDAQTARKIMALDSTLQGEEACGCRPINGLLHLLKQKGLGIDQVLVRNSGDTAGDHSRVVGYGAWSVAGTSASTGQKAERPVTTRRQSLPLAHRQQLVQLARDAIRHPLTSREKFHLDLNHFPAPLRAEGASFVTLNIDGRLRGCIGSLVAHRPLVIDVANNAQAAAYNDPRFGPLSLDEYQRVDVHISVLSAPEPMSVSSREDLIEQLRPGVDGLILEERGRRATYLPSVWEQLPDPETFVAELRAKAGLPRDGWSPETTVSRYTTEEFA
ncbi:MAG: AmmeMemoRadiSam system protein B [Pseudomonadales bacterium]|nr:AmmeMemoRadiSam system protein B [Pseudomonadales bacterium]